MIWSFGHGSLSLETPHYVGILNLTPDSFSDGGTATRPEQAVEKGSHLLRHGASALDLGGESTRPDALPVAVDEEWRRVEPALQALRHALPEGPLSLDSRHADVAAQGLAQGVTILNDVTGFQDPAMLDLARRSEVGVIAMRSRVSEGRFHMPPYDDPAPRTADLALEELRAVKARLLDAGLAPERILLDPGFGFGTTFREDLALWEALPRLEAELDWPASRVCIGLSRKRFLAWRQGAPETPPRERDAFTHQAHAEAYAWGFRVFRTHTLPEPLVRPARPDDAKAIAAVHLTSWRVAYRGVLLNTFLESLSLEGKIALAQHALEEGQNSRHRLRVLDQGGRILGFCVSGPSLPPKGEVFALYVHPSRWRQGLGRQLLMESVEAMRAAGFPTGSLWVLEHNERARGFYEKLGWQRSGGVRHLWQGGIILRELEYVLPLS